MAIGCLVKASRKVVPSGTVEPANRGRCHNWTVSKNQAAQQHEAHDGLNWRFLIHRGSGLPHRRLTDPPHFAPRPAVARRPACAPHVYRGHPLLAVVASGAGGSGGGACPVRAPRGGARLAASAAALPAATACPNAPSQPTSPTCAVGRPRRLPLLPAGAAFGVRSPPPRCASPSPVASFFPSPPVPAPSLLVWRPP